MAGKGRQDGPQTGDQVRPPAEEDGKGPARGKDQQEEVIRRWEMTTGESSSAPSATN